MEIRDLRYLAAVAEAGSIAAAAATLGLSSSTLSRRLAKFEDDLGLTLFERGRLGIRLTNGGRAVLSPVLKILTDLAEISEMARGSGLGQRGNIRLGVRLPPVGEPIRGLLQAWRRRHPEVSLTIFEMTDQELQTAIESRRLDAAFVANYALWPGATTTPIYRERLFAALPTDHVLSTRDALDWSSLRPEIILVQDWPDSHATRNYYASLIGQEAKIYPHPAGEQSVFGLVSAGFGITLATASQAQVVFPGVHFKPISECDAWIEIELAWASQSEEAVVGVFIAFMRDAVSLGTSS